MWSALRCLNKIKIPSLMKTRIRHYMKTSDKMALLLKQADHVPFNCELVYRHKSTRMGSIMYHSVNLIAIITFTSASYHAYSSGFKVKEGVPEMIKMFTNPFQTAILITTNIAMIVFVSVLRKRYVIRMYYNDKNKMYRAIFTGKFPFTIEYHSFPPASLTSVSRNSVLPWRNTLFNASGRKIMLFEENFRTQGDFYAMLHPQELESNKL